MKYHGRVLQKAIDNTLILVLTENINIDSILYARESIFNFASTHQNGFYFIVIFKDNTILPMNCIQQVLKSQKEYIRMGLKKYYICCNSDLQKSLLTNMLVTPLKHPNLYVLENTIETIFLEIENNEEINIELIKRTYSEMKELMKKNTRSKYDILPEA